MTQFDSICEEQKKIGYEKIFLILCDVSYSAS